jgi:hypothetical protein
MLGKTQIEQLLIKIDTQVSAEWQMIRGQSQILIDRNDGVQPSDVSGDKHMINA